MKLGKTDESLLFLLYQKSMIGFQKAIMWPYRSLWLCSRHDKENTGLCAMFVCNVQCTVCRVQCAIFCMQWSGCIVQCSVYTVHLGKNLGIQLLPMALLTIIPWGSDGLGSITETRQYTVYSVRYTLYRGQWTLYKVLLTLHIVQTQIYIIHFTGYSR